MFLKLKDGRLVNTNKISLVEPFTAAVAAERIYGGYRDGLREECTQNYLDDHTRYNARLLMQDVEYRNNVPMDEGRVLIEETPAEFQAKAINLQVTTAATIQEAREDLVELVARQLGPNYDGPG